MRLGQPSPYPLSPSCSVEAPNSPEHGPQHVGGGSGVCVCVWGGGDGGVALVGKKLNTIGHDREHCIYIKPHRYNYTTNVGYCGGKPEKVHTLAYLPISLEQRCAEKLYS